MPPERFPARRTGERSRVLPALAATFLLMAAPSAVAARQVPDPAGADPTITAPPDPTAPDGADADGTPGTGSRASLWCSFADAGDRRLFVSDLVPLDHPSPFRVWDVQSRFARAVVGAGGPATANGNGACRTAHSAPAAAAERGALVRRMAAQQWVVVTIGVF